MRSLCIHASQVAACIGHNRFKKAHEARESVWQRVAPESFAAALARHGIKTADDAVRDIASSNATVRTLLVEAEETLTKTSADVAKGYEDVSQRLADAQLTWEERRLVDDAMKKSMYTSFGTRQEHVVLSRISDTVVACAPDDTFYKQVIHEVDGTQVILGGRIDALSADGGHTVVEIKNRINRLFYKLPVYEHIQVQCYLQLVETAERGVLVECLTREDGQVLLNAVHLERDEALWHGTILPRLRNFVAYLLKLLDSPEVQDAYLRHGKKAAFVSSLLDTQSPSPATPA